MTDQKKIQHTANSLNAMIDRICARNGWTQDETLRPKSKISVTVKVAMPKLASSIASKPIEQTNSNMTLEEYKKEVADYLRKYMKYSDKEIEDAMEMYEPVFQENLEDGFTVAMMATQMYHEL